MMKLKILAVCLIALFSCHLYAGGFGSPAFNENIQEYTYQKPGASVRLVAPSLGTLELGETQRLLYKFVSGAKSGLASLQVSIDDGLQHSALPLYEFDLAKQEFEIEFDVSAQQNGVFYIRFMVEFEGQFRALGHRIQVGELETTELEKPKGVLGGIRSMPAQETILKK